MNRLNELNDLDSEHEINTNQVVIDIEPQIFQDYTSLIKKLKLIENNIKELKFSIENYEIISKERDEKIIEMQTKLGNEIKATKSQIENLTREIFSPNSEEIINIKKQQNKALIQRLSDIIRDYQELNNEYKNKKTKVIVHMIQITHADQNLTDEQTQEIAQDLIISGANLNLFSQSKDKLAEIIENKNDILRIEQSMKELNQMFIDLAILVNEQGEGLVDIDKNVDRANNVVESGRH